MVWWMATLRFHKDGSRTLTLGGILFYFVLFAKVNAGMSTTLGHYTTLDMIDEESEFIKRLFHELR